MDYKKVDECDFFEDLVYHNEIADRHGRYEYIIRKDGLYDDYDEYEGVYIQTTAPVDKIDEKYIDNYIYDVRYVYEESRQEQYVFKPMYVRVNGFLEECGTIEVEEEYKCHITVDKINDDEYKIVLTTGWKETVINKNY